MTILVTGALGSTGAEMVKFLREKRDYDQLWYSGRGDLKDIRYVQCDLTNAFATYNLIKKVNPDEIYHLAGSFSNLFEVDFNANVLATKYLLEAIIKINRKIRILLIGSAAEYGVIEGIDNPIMETHPLNPTTNYGLTKFFQTKLMDFYCRTEGLNIVMARTFNIKSKSLSPRLFLGKLYRQIDDYKKGSIDKIETGDLSFIRDYLPIRQALNYYLEIMKKGLPNEVYNVASGFPIVISALLQEILTEEGIDPNVVVSQKINPSQTSTTKKVYASIAKVKALISEVP